MESFLALSCIAPVAACMVRLAKRGEDRGLHFVVYHLQEAAAAVAQETYPLFV